MSNIPIPCHSDKPLLTCAMWYTHTDVLVPLYLTKVLSFSESHIMHQMQVDARQCDQSVQFHAALSVDNLRGWSPAPWSPPKARPQSATCLVSDCGGAKIQEPATWDMEMKNIYIRILRTCKDYLYFLYLNTNKPTFSTLLDYICFEM